MIEVVGPGWLRCRRSAARSLRCVVQSEAIQAEHGRSPPDPQVVSMITRLVEADLENEQQLRKQIAELDSLFRNSPNGVGVLDHQFRFVRVNDAMARFHGRSPQSFVDRSVAELFPGLPDDFLAGLRQGIGANGPLLDVELSLKSANDESSTRHFLAHFYPLNTAQDGGESSGMVLVDITKRKHADEALRLSEERYPVVVEHSVYGVCRVGETGTANAGNPAMRLILCCRSAEQFAALNFFRDVFRYPDQQAQILAGCKTQGSVHNVQAEWRRRDGGLVEGWLQFRKF